MISQDYKIDITSSEYDKLNDQTIATMLYRGSYQMSKPITCFNDLARTSYRYEEHLIFSALLNYNDFCKYELNIDEDDSNFVKEMRSLQDKITYNEYYTHNFYNYGPEAEYMDIMTKENIDKIRSILNKYAGLLMKHSNKVTNSTCLLS